jgi:hypothetical protein
MMFKGLLADFGASDAAVLDVSLANINPAGQILIKRNAIKNG